MVASRAACESSTTCIPIQNQVGEHAILKCRADYAYGETGSPPTIPGGATLDFDVELIR